VAQAYKKVLIISGIEKLSTKYINVDLIRKLVKDPFNVADATKMRNITGAISDETKKILKKLTKKKESIQVDGIIDTLNKYISGAIKINNPLNIAENLHNGHYIERVNNSQLWTMKNFYERLKYNVGLIDIGRKFLSQKNYHGAFETFHIARYSQGLLDMTKNIVDEVKKGNRNNIGYAKKALVDIVQFEGKERAKEYSNIIADAYIKDYLSLEITDPKKRLMEMEYKKHNLDDALELYNLNGNIIKKLKTYNMKLRHKSDFSTDSTKKYITTGIL
jgi:hypothetical protein